MEEGTVRADSTLCLFIASGRQLSLLYKISISIFTDGLTDRIKEVLDTPEGEVDIEPAALLLSKLNRNRILYESVPRRKNADKLKYGLRKIHTFRSREESVKETEALEKEAVNIIKKNIPERGKTASPAEQGDASGSRPASGGNQSRVSGKPECLSGNAETPRAAEAAEYRPVL
jgi:hypothetical protein